MQKLLQFIKYNNAFTIIISLILFSTAGAFANEKVRDTVIGQTIVTKNGTDNTRIISADLDNFDMGLKIKSVKEDDKFYYVNFDYNAIDAKDGVWQTVKKEKNVNVSKTRLGEMDLGVYLAEELKQLTDREFAYMKEVQNIEKNKGAQKQTESVEYTGLKGLVFDNEKKEIVGYEEVKEEENQKAEVLGIFNPSTKTEEKKNAEKEENEKVVQQITVVKETVSRETIMQMVREAMAQEQSGGSSASASSSSSSSSAVSGGGAGTQTSPEASSSSSSAPSSESSSASSTSDVLPSQSLPAGEAGSSSTSDVIPAASSSSESSSDASSESSTSSISPISESSSSSEPTSDVGSSSSESSSSSSAEAVSSAASSEAVSSSSSSESSSASSDLSAGEAEPAP